jgi:hypothetical protein
MGTRAWHHRDGSECFSAKVWQNDDDPNRGTCEMHERVVCYAELAAEPPTEPVVCTACGWVVGQDDDGVWVTHEPGVPDLATCGGTDHPHEVPDTAEMLELAVPPEPERVEQLSYREALDYALFAVNTWMHPDASDGRDIIALEANSDAVIATLVDIRDVVQGAPAPAPDYDTSRQTFMDAINLGIEVESDDPAFGSDVKALTPAQVAWISSWLAGEGHR